MFETHVSPRFNEADALGHISNTVMPIWFEEARKPIFQLIHPAMTIEDWPIILAHIDVDFIKQIFVNQEVTIKSQVEKIGNSSFTIYQEAWQGNELAAAGKCVLVYFDYKNQKTANIPEAIKEKLLECSANPA